MYHTRRELASLRKQRWKNTIENMDVEENTMWKVSKVLRKKKTSLPPIHGQCGVVYINKEKVEAFADSLEQQCLLNYNEDLDTNHVTRVHKHVDSNYNDLSQENIKYSTLE